MWTKEKIELLRLLYPNTDNETIADELGINKGYIIKKANNLGLFKTNNYISELRKKNNPQCEWSDTDISKLKSLYKTHSNNELSKILNYSKKQVIRKLKRLELYRDKKDVVYIKSKANKIRGRDLTFDLVKECAKKYNTKHEFYLKDPSVYSTALKEKWLDKVTSHMICGNFSIPQLMLKDLLEFILGEKCKYNDRVAIKPLEIDCYFPIFKLGWEYDGKYYHKNGVNSNKIKKALDNGIRLLIIDELTPNYRDYNLNIKTQIIDQLDIINTLTNKNITEKMVLDYDIKINYPNLLTLDETNFVLNKKMSEIKNKDLDLFKRIKKYKLYENPKYSIIYDLRPNNRFKNYDEYYEYLIKCNYNSFKDLCKKEHPHRLMKKWGLDINLIKNIFK